MMPLKDTIKFEDFAKIDFRVATITEAQYHPNADRLLKIQLDDGSEEGRQICAGIRGHYEPADLIGKQVIVVANLEPRKIRGELSNGMLLAGSSLADADNPESERTVILLTTMAPLPPGSTVS